MRRAVDGVFRPTIVILLGLVVLLATACAGDDDGGNGGPGGQTSGGGAGTGGAGTGIGGVGPGGGGTGGASPELIALAPTEGTLSLDFDVAIQGEGLDFVGAVDLVGGAGTVELDGVAYPAVTYERQDFGIYTLYQTFVAGADRWYIVWAYCDGPDFVAMYFEGTDGTALAYEDAVGSCAEGPGPVQAEVSFPAISMAPPTLIDDYTIEGPSVSLQPGEAGIVDLGTPHVVLPFEQVDCTTECGSSPGWREVHAILWDQANARACFGIFYLFEGDTEILLTYALTLPDLSDPAGVLPLAATWSYAP